MDTACPLSSDVMIVEAFSPIITGVALSKS